MKRYSQAAAFVLTGGASSRMGRDKALLDFGGVPLVQRTARLLDPLVAEVTLVGPPDRYAGLGLRVIKDQFIAKTKGMPPTFGPLAGIATALAVTCSPWNLILSCDLPYLSGAWLDWLLSRAMASRAQAVIPESAHGLEPLAAIYRRECAGPISAALERGVRKVTDALQELRLEPIEESEWRHIDPSGLVLKNMNSPEDYNGALNWWRGL